MCVMIHWRLVCASFTLRGAHPKNTHSTYMPAHTSFLHTAIFHSQSKETKVAVKGKSAQLDVFSADKKAEIPSYPFVAL